MIKKLVCSLLIAVSVITIMPIMVHAEWKQDNTGWWYTNGNSYYTEWKQIDNSWYYFGSDGYMEKGWIKDKAWWYYLQDNGTMATGKVSIKDKTYEFDKSGKWINNGLPSKISSTSTSAKPSEEKLKAARDFSWFSENGNTYFKVMDTIYAYGGWNIDGDIYVFDENGVLQKGEYTGKNGYKYLLGSDGKFIKGITDENYELWAQGAITTKSTTDNFSVNLDDSHMMDLTCVNSNDPAKNGTLIKEGTGYKLDSTNPKATVDGKTLYCKTDQYIYLGKIEVQSTDSKSSSFPNLLVISSSTDNSIVYTGVDISLEGGFYKSVYPKIMAHKPGKAAVTVNVNGTKTTFDVVVTE